MTQSVENERFASSRAYRTVAQLTAAAIEVFEEQGFHPAQVADIAERAGVSRATFYNYFASKEALLRHMVRAVIPDLVFAPEKTAADATPHERLRAITTAYLDGYRHHATLMDIWREAAQRNPEMATFLQDAREPFLTRTEQSFRRWQSEGFAHPGIDPSYAAHALTGMVANFAYVWFVEGVGFDREQAIDTLTLLWAGAMGIPTDPPAPA